MWNLFMCVCVCVLCFWARCRPPSHSVDWMVLYCFSLSVCMRFFLFLQQCYTKTYSHSFTGSIGRRTAARRLSSLLVPYTFTRLMLHYSLHTRYNARIYSNKNMCVLCSAFTQLQTKQQKIMIIMVKGMVDKIDLPKRFILKCQHVHRASVRFVNFHIRMPKRCVCAILLWTSLPN